MLSHIRLEGVKGFQIMEQRAHGTGLKGIDGAHVQDEVLRRSRILSLAIPTTVVARCKEIWAHPDRLTPTQQTALLEWMKEEGLQIGDHPFGS